MTARDCATCVGVGTGAVALIVDGRRAQLVLCAECEAAIAEGGSDGGDVAFDFVQEVREARRGIRSDLGSQRAWAWSRAS